jgi:hypothetical protein
MGVPQPLLMPIILLYFIAVASRRRHYSLQGRRNWAMCGRLALDSAAVELILWQWSPLPGAMG